MPDVAFLPWYVSRSPSPDRRSAYRFPSVRKDLRIIRSWSGCSGSPGDEMVCESSVPRAPEVCVRAARAVQLLWELRPLL